ncbi:MAG: FAD-dependent oxidoreductase [Betaproteobacteria bacterium]|nr:FAD-dependent oxidoreductase [Betaproteobacteria bacterium]
MKIAVIGSGISGISCAWLLARHSADAHQVTLYEQNDYLGGHTNTIDVTLDGTTYPVDTGFLVYNDWTYPNLIAMFKYIGIESAPSDMSFGIKLLDDAGRGKLEWCGSNDIRTVFAQPANLFRPAFLGMLRDLLRFNREATALADRSRGDGAELPGTLGQYLDAHGYGMAFRDWYLKPMAACIWSTPTQKIDEFPLATFINFCRNHGLISVNDRPQWRTVKDGTCSYIRKLAAELPDIRLNAKISRIDRAGNGVTIHADSGIAQYDHIVFACHTDQALTLLRDGDEETSAILAAIPYQPNVAILHTDTRLLPDRQRAWAAWNYMAWHPDAGGGRKDADTPVSLSYLINRLQPLPFKTPVIVTMNPLIAPDPSKVIKTIHYEHPAFLAGSAVAKRQLRAVQGRRNIWYAGAWTRYGFHEDGLMSGIAVAKALGATVPWQTNVPAANDPTTPYPGVDA